MTQTQVKPDTKPRPTPSRADRLVLGLLPLIGGVVLAMRASKDRSGWGDIIGGGLIFLILIVGLILVRRLRKLDGR